MTAVFFEKRDELCQEQKTEAACWRDLAPPLERFARRSANITDLENAKASEGEVGGFENGP
jgi:hypothetical protein